MIKEQPETAYENNFDTIGRFIIEDYDQKRPFSSFLPGIAGLQGIPMWVFYVNRGQAVCSFGVENKDHPMLEFQAANKAYQTTALTGFRTFLNGIRPGERWTREVFSPWQAPDVQRTMYIGMNEVEIQEVNNALGYQVNVLYFMLPNAPISGLVRKVSFKNLKHSPLTLEIVDGLPGVVPYGVDDGALKNIGRTIEAWMQVDNLDNKIPFYRLKATPGDSAAVDTIEAGNYALAFEDDALLPAIADPSVLFGLDTGRSKAHLFHELGLDKDFTTPQTLEGRSLCAFFGTTQVINPGNIKTLTSLYGYSRSLSSIHSSVERISSSVYLPQKLLEARDLTDDLTHPIGTKSVSLTFDGYCRQTFLDNLLRGGYPLMLGDNALTYVYSRKHGDIERDYNYFVIAPEYYSQGNGNYRDINQNRRNDVFFVPQSGEFNIRLFMSLIQSDGYNPLVINGLTFSIPEERRAKLSACIGNHQKLNQILQREFTPGEVVRVVLEEDDTLPVKEVLFQVFSNVKTHIQAEHGEGYWVDHWTYNLDLIESYLTIYPDNKAGLLFESAPLPFYDNAHVVLPRKDRYVLYHGKPRQLNAVVEDQEKVRLINARGESHHWARNKQGRGEIFVLPLCSKLLLLVVLKFATRDPSGFGIQMEAGRPGWYDALNGLPGLFGSSMPETYELLRLVQFLITALDDAPHQISLPVEVRALLEAIVDRQLFKRKPFEIWEKMSDLLEQYRDATRLGFDGSTITVDAMDYLGLIQGYLESGIQAAETFFGDIPPTYFIHQVSDYALTGTLDLHGYPTIQVKEFEPVALPAFLEGPVRRMKISSHQEARRIYSEVKNGDLFDRKLKMYKVNASLKTQPHEIGRARAFTPGWLENESVWMHMAFKYLLELQKAGLYDEFFKALKIHLPAFMNFDVYGRSPLENSSFIVSSAHPDQNLHGAGFVARLSGSTAEFLSMWVIMTAGQQPFRVDAGQLVLAFSPSLPGWLFTEDGDFAFRFLDACQVKIHNPFRIDTYAENETIKQIVLHSTDGNININGSVIKSPYAERVRCGEILEIELFY